MIVYLLHFDEPLGDLDNPRGQARHYIGTAHDVEIRLRQHRKGYGARITQVLWERGIDFKLARTWEGGRDVERRLKRRKNAPKLCPICIMLEG